MESFIWGIPAGFSDMATWMVAEPARGSQKTFTKGMGPSPAPPDQEFSESLQTAKCQHRSQHQGDTRDCAAWVCLPPCSLKSCFQTSLLLFHLDEGDMSCFLRQEAEF